MNAFLGNVQFEQIVQIVLPQGRLLRAWSLSGGISAEMTVLEVAMPDGLTQKLVVRQFGGEQSGQTLHPAAKEFQLLQITNTAGLATPKPYYLDLSGQILPAPYLVIEFVPGEMVLAPANRTTYLTQLADHLAGIHRFNGTDFDLSFLGEPITACAEMARPAVDKSLFDEAKIRAVLASYQLVESSTHLTLLHGDFWPGNSLWQDGQLVAVIDWEDAALGDPLMDLARSRSEIAWIFGLEAMNTFTACYQSLMPLDYTHLPFWDLCAALRFIRLFGANLADAAAYFAPFGRHDITPQTIVRDVQGFVSQALTALGM